MSWCFYQVTLVMQEATLVMQEVTAFWEVTVFWVIEPLTKTSVKKEILTCADADQTDSQLTYLKEVEVLWISQAV